MHGSVVGPRSWERHMVRNREVQKRTGGSTEFIPLPFVTMASPIYLQRKSRRGPNELNQPLDLLGGRGGHHRLRNRRRLRHRYDVDRDPPQRTPWERAARTIVCALRIDVGLRPDSRSARYQRSISATFSRSSRTSHRCGLIWFLI